MFHLFLFIPLMSFANLDLQGTWVTNDGVVLLQTYDKEKTELYELKYLPTEPVNFQSFYTKAVHSAKKGDTCVFEVEKGTPSLLLKLKNCPNGEWSGSKLPFVLSLTQISKVKLNSLGFFDYLPGKITWCFKNPLQLRLCELEKIEDEKSSFKKNLRSLESDLRIFEGEAPYQASNWTSANFEEVIKSCERRIPLDECLRKKVSEQAEVFTGLKKDAYLKEYQAMQEYKKKLEQMQISTFPLRGTYIINSCPQEGLKGFAKVEGDGQLSIDATTNYYFGNGRRGGCQLYSHPLKKTSDKNWIALVGTADEDYKKKLQHDGRNLSEVQLVKELNDFCLAKVKTDDDGKNIEVSTIGRGCKVFCHEAPESEIIDSKLPAVSASFPCEKASSTVEKLICGSDQLKIYDWNMAQYYKAAKKNPKLIKDQMSWLNARNSCTTEECLKTKYDERLMVFEAMFPMPDSAGDENEETVDGTEDGDVGTNKCTLRII